MGSEMCIRDRCNSCGKEIAGQALTTFCSHCYCLGASQSTQADLTLSISSGKRSPAGLVTDITGGCCADCANEICQGDNRCRVCGQQLDGSNVSVEVSGDGESVLRSLCGSSPEEIIMVSATSLNWRERLYMDKLKLPWCTC